MDAGRRWALEMLGTHGPLIRDRIPALIKAEHNGSLGAQDASGHRSTGHYGLFWRGILEKFEEFGQLPGATLVRPDKAPYKIPVVNGVAVFPWRYSPSIKRDMASVRFGTSDSRTAVSDLRPPSLQGELDLDVPDPQLTDEERSLVDSFESYVKDPVVDSGRLVLVAICSSVRGLNAAQWGEAVLDSNGFVSWVAQPEDLLVLPEMRPVSTSPVGTFASGPIPNKFPISGSDKASGSNE
ncbi:hypothetical protein [Rhodococcus sp. NBC_00294]|uniref:hypothetical protein n=1 Tax=Rhodococcus sp. NBC_00294 TaxID=2976004 RepID=UPI002E2B19F9|nr:hypothetical protein [Rhodococcus sp. NBC_00294]